MDFPSANITASAAIQRLLDILKAQDTSGILTTEQRVTSTLDITVAKCVEHITARLTGNTDGAAETAIVTNLTSCFDLLNNEWQAGAVDQALVDLLLARAALIRDLLSLADAVTPKSSS